MTCLDLATSSSFPHVGQTSAPCMPMRLVSLRQHRCTFAISLELFKTITCMYTMETLVEVVRGAHQQLASPKSQVHSPRVQARRINL